MASEPLTERHVFDEDGDLLLLLAIPFGVNDQSEATEDAAPDALEDTPMEDAGEVLDAEPTPTNALRSRRQKQASTEPPVNYELLVSSKHLALASPVFKAMLKHNNFQGPRDPNEAGPIKISLPDDDPWIMIIFMDIIHGKNRRVPKDIVSLEEMTEIAIAADKWQMVEAIEFFAQNWIELLLPSIPKVYLKKSIRIVHEWLAISWVFGRKEEFKEMTRMMMRGCKDDPKTLIEHGLPIPDIVLEKIQESRLSAIQHCYSIVAQKIKEYLEEPNSKCPRGIAGNDTEYLRISCDLLTLGSLMKNAFEEKLYPTPEVLDNISFAKLSSRIKSMDLTCICDSVIPMPGGIYSSPCHGIPKLFKSELEKREKIICGLDLDDFKIYKYTTSRQ